ncbi:WecB/TagA/CpsF family glycosyltransferase [Pelagicoccus sp. SDUM812002]|uniref:WecB/TagA/CpsF family glycosyltransferase n=1 Tax=Pelagicoccus sp. SDUM812002 TaxID=3041266 RepID=UPI00280D9A85|nr:WecB/TagA/CpsF family glycosyltransferase [Pelagicoccus sp. SDUM812002]MDQ8188177.1 WecB/TagA/CpsF family glycosyltransferase [Pelagicoccus sp. SDUM812002]
MSSANESQLSYTSLGVNSDTEPYLSCSALGVNFVDEPVERCIDIVSEGGLLVVPSGPGLARIDKDEFYREAVQGAAFALADSGYMVLLLRLFKRRSLHRISGLRFIDALLNHEGFKNDASTMWVMPNELEVLPTKAVLSERGVTFSDDGFVIAPMYPHEGRVEDPQLLAEIEAKRPRWVILNVAGGKQEKLGYYLTTNLSYKPTIVCTGAAIAFLSGEQAHIPVWADRLYLGWLFRIMQSPRLYTQRYLEASTLIRKIAFNRNLNVSRSYRSYLVKT